MIGGVPQFTSVMNVFAVPEHVEKETSDHISPNDHDLWNTDLKCNRFRHGEVGWQGLFEDADLQSGHLVLQSAGRASWYALVSLKILVPHLVMKGRG